MTQPYAVGKRRRALLWLASILSIGGMGIYLWSKGDQLQPLIQVPAAQAVLVGVLVSVGIMLNAVEFLILYRRLGARLGVVENWLLFSAGQLLNHIPGQIGTLYRLRYLKAVHDTSYSRSASAYGANLVLTVLSTGAIGVVACVVIGLAYNTWSPVVIGGFALALVTSTLTLVVPIHTVEGSGLWARAVRGFSAGWSELWSHNVTGIIVLIELVKYAVLAWRVQISLGWVGVEAPYVFFLPLAAVTGLANFIALTPAALGVRELAVGFTARALGVEFNPALMGAALDRAVTIVWVGVIGGIGLLYTARKSAIAAIR